MRYLFVFIILWLSTSVSAQDAMSVWTPSPITIDGRAKDWPSFFRFYISGAKVQFDFFNDSSDLYICLKAVDVDAQARLMHAGVDIWFDPLGKKKQKIGINFPMKMERSAEDAGRRSRAHSDPSLEPSEHSRASRLRESVVFSQTNVKVAGMVAVTEPVIPLQNKYGIDIAYDWDSLNILSVEYKIPLSLILQHPVSATDMQHPLGLGIAVGAIESPHPEQASPSSSTGGQRGGMGSANGGMGGGRSGGGHGMGGSGNSPTNDRYNTDNGEQKVWLKVHLLDKPAL